MPRRWLELLLLATLYEFIRSGDMPMAVGGIDHIDMIELENGDCKIRLR